MNLFRLMLLFCVLLAQGWPVQAAASSAADLSEAACQEGCCAWLMEEGVALCACEQTPAPATPASLPPTSGRDQVPQAVWMEQDPEWLPRMKVPAKGSAKAVTQWHEREVAATPAVRLPVLFCAFLN